MVKKYINLFVNDLRNSFLDLAVIIGIITFFQLVIIGSIPENWPSMVFGLAVVAIGLALFTRGLDAGIFPLGEDLAQNLASSKARFWVVLFGFVIGFATTIAEPALIAIAGKAAVISGGQINALILRVVVALAVGCAIALGVVRILLNHPVHWYIIVGYIFVLGVTYFAPPEIVGLAYDSGGVTTSTVTVPLIAALGIGLATTLKNRNPIIDGFGLIAFASLTPMIFVQLYGIAAYSLDTTPAEVVEIGEQLESGFTDSVNLLDYGIRLIMAVVDVLPIILTILFFYYIVLKKRIESLNSRAAGFALVILGLYVFVIGLEFGLFPIGESIAIQLTEKGNLLLVYLFAFTMGFATTIAEPALTAIAKRAEVISGGAIKSTLLRVFVATGVGIGLLLGAYRIVQGDSIVWYIIAGYIVVVLLTFFAPRTTIPIAYDSGGVTTSTVTVPIVAALGLGLASTIPGRDVLIDGFGLIAFASLFPMITVLGYGIIESHSIRLHERKIDRMESKAMGRVLDHLEEEIHAAEDQMPRHKAIRKQIVSISGDPGSGVSTVSKQLAEKLRYRKFSSGDLFRKIAENHHITVEQLNKVAEERDNVDHEVDELIKELGETDSKLVIDSRLAYHWIHNSFKVFLSIDPLVGSQRILDQIQEKGRAGEQASSVEEVLISNERRIESKRKRFQELYGIDISNKNPFDLVVKTDDKKPEEIVEIVAKAYTAWLHAGQKKK